MKLVGGLLVALFLAAFTMLASTSRPADAQGSLSVDLFEDPFVCDAVVRALGTVTGFISGEPVEFSSPQLNGVFSTRTADGAGRVAMRWNCSAAQVWSVTVRGLVSGSSSSFVLTGIAAPPPPDAPIGAAFDAKSAMTTAEMAIWKDFSPFSTVGIYIPVNTDWDNRADKVQSNLTSSWTNTVLQDGWSLIPIYVGRQAPDPCQTARFEGISSDVTLARNQGFEAAADAVTSVTDLGIAAGSPIYYDMEAYRPGCADAVLAFLDAWTEGVHQAGFVSGIYGSRSSTMSDLSRAFGRAGFDAPDAVWVSTGNGRAGALGLEVPSDGLWTNARIHQYRLSVTRTYGGVTREIDENIVDAPLARYSPPAPVIVDNDGDGFAEPAPDNCDNIANPDQADLDADGDGDACDPDIDGDGINNDADFAPLDASISVAPQPTAAPTAVIVDNDGDGFADPAPDNCDNIANPSQADLDADGDGDACDSDIDGDGISNEADLDPLDATVGSPPPSPTVEQTPTAEPNAPTEEAPPDQATPAPVAGDDSTTDPAPAAPPTADPTPTAPPARVIVLPTPLPTEAAPEPLPAGTTTQEPAEPNIDEPQQVVSDAELMPTGSLELAQDTVTITIEDDSPVLPYAVAALAAFSVFCVGMGVRSFRRSRL